MIRSARLLILLSVSSASCSLLTSNDLDAIRKSRDAGGTPQLIADRTSLDFGLAPVGQPSPAAIIRLTNTGTGPAGTVTAALSGAGAASFAAGATTSCDGLAAGASCDLSLTYTASGALAESATLTVTGAPGGTLTIALSGEGVVAGTLSVTPSLVDFGSVVPPGQSGTLAFTVRNTGSVATGALETGVAGSDQLQFEVTTDACAGLSLAPGDSCTLAARFAPALPGPRRASLRVSGAPGGTGLAALIGDGLAGGGQLSIAPTSRTLPNVAAGSQGAPVTFRVTNSGAAATGPISLALTGSGALDFELLSTDCSALQPTTSCNAQVRFRPASAGPKVATLRATADPGGNATSSLSATADTAAALEATPPSVDFGTVVTSTPAISTLTFRNPGAVATGVLTAAITDQDAGVFTVVGGCNVALMPAQNCQLDVRFAPTSAGQQTASLVVSASPGGAITVPLTGLGASPGALTLSPAAHAFGQVVAGGMGTPRTFTATNTGGTDTSALSVDLGGTNLDQYVLLSDLCSGMTLAPQASCDVSVSFSPTGGGSKSASLTVSATNGGTAVSLLNGAGLLPAALGVNPTMADFLGSVVGQQGIAIDFDVTNGGDVATSSALMSSLTGPHASSFIITGDGCATGTLGPSATCRVTVAFSPALGSPGVKTATLEVRPVSGAGGTVTASLSGTAQNPSALTFDSQPFGPVQLGMPLVRTFTLTNDGGTPSGGVTLALGGANANEFQVLNAVGTDCRADGGTVAGGSSCTVRVQWTPATRGSPAAQLTANATPGGPATVNFIGTGLQQATLSSAATTASLGAVQNGLPTAPFNWVITNVGDLASGVPTIPKTGANQAEFNATGCAGALDAGASCTVAVTLTPASAGTRNANIRVTATPGGFVNLGASGTGRALITVVKTDGGAGRVFSDNLAIDCGPTCFSQSALFDLAAVGLHARTTNGVSAVFNGWDGGCQSFGSNRDCTITSDVNQTVAAKFGSRDNNIIFVSDVPVPRNLGSLAAYDARCNLMASDAGINGLTNQYIAVLSSSTTSFTSRLGTTARGFVRVDGRAVGDTKADVLTLLKVLNPISIDQFGGSQLGELPVMTGTNSDGTSGPLDQTCNNWTTEASGPPPLGYYFGSSRGGPGAWLTLNGLTCDTPAHLYCMMNVRTAPLMATATAGKKMWVTTTAYIPGAQTPDAKCLGERPVGVGTAVKALVGRTNPGGSAPVAALVAGTTYVRPDGQLIGTYAELVRTEDFISSLHSGVWQTAALTYYSGPVWTGAGDPNILTSIPVANTCSNWTSTSNAVSGSGGSSWASDRRWFLDYGDPCDNTAYHLICVEQ